MSHHNRGVSTVECLVALTMLAVGALGAAGMSAYALRTVVEGNRAARAARLLAAQTGRLRLGVRQSGGSCLALSGGLVSGSDGEQVQWLVGPSLGGRDLNFLVTFPTVRGQHIDTATGFVACR